MHVLVSAASKHGATQEIAEAIAVEIARRGHEVTNQDPASVTDITPFDALVLGSAVYAGRWQKSARGLVTRIESQIGSRPVWLFSSGPIGDPPMPTTDPVDVEDIRAATSARDHRVFAGRLELSTLTFGERAIVAALRADFGDFRDWEAIRQWAAEIASALGHGAAATDTGHTA
jgi:menaquinone-dependent protoporphyrinogen oxidase